MANFCRNCGAKLYPGAKFCSSCGEKVFEIPAQDRRYPERPVPAGRKSSDRQSALAFVLIVIMVIELAIAGTKYPGFFRPQDGGGTSVIAHNNNNPTNGLDSSDVVSDVLPQTLPMTDEIGLRYSESEIDAAPVQTAAVSPDNPVVQMGDVQVDFKSWNLDGEDELSVRELEQRSDGENGWTIKAYDFSLKSGQSEFATNVEIRIPRTATSAEMGSCIGFNEKTGKWEDLPYEISEDQKSYILYTNHFSLKAEKLKLIMKNYALIDNAGGVEYLLDGGIFREMFAAGQGGTRMNMPVQLDTDILWNLYDKKTESEVKEFTYMIAKAEDQNAAAQKLLKGESMRSFFGDIGDMDNFETIFSSTFNSGLIPPEASDALATVNLMLLLEKIEAEARLGNKSYIDNLMGAINKNKTQLLEWAAAAAVAAEFGNLYGAVFAVGIMAVKSQYDSYTFWDRIRTNSADNPWNPNEEYFYRYFYGCGSGNTYTADYNPAGNFNSITMAQPANMDDNKFKEFSEFVNNLHDKKKYLYVKETGEGDTRSYTASAAWSEVFAEIFRLYADEPWKIPEVINDFYRSFASAFWFQPQSWLDRFLKASKEFKDTPDEFTTQKTIDRFYVTDENASFGKGKVWRLKVPSGSERTEMEDRFIEQLRAATGDQLAAAANMVKREKYTSQENILKEYLISALNTKLVFHVKIESADGKETPFSESIYCKDWRSIKENESYLTIEAGDTGRRFDSMSFITPMRFANAGSPLFIPLELDGSEGSAVNYYPYNASFTPRAKEGSDVVYTCTLYHYLMMGLPDKMEFRDVSDPKSYAKQTPVIGEMKFPKIDKDTKQADVMVVIKAKNDIRELEGRWASPMEGSEYENKGSLQYSLDVEKGGTVNTFIIFENQKEKSRFSQNETGGDSIFAYTLDETKKSGLLTIRNNTTGESQNLNIDIINNKTIYIRELDHYLERADILAGSYSLSVERIQGSPPGGSSTITITDQGNASFSAEADGSLDISIPAINYSKTNSSGSNTSTCSMSGIRIRAALSNQPDMFDYDYGGTVVKTYYITECTSPISLRYESKSKNGKKSGKDLTLKNIDLYSRQKEVKSRVLLYFDKNNKNMLKHVVMNINSSEGYLVCNFKQ